MESFTNLTRNKLTQSYLVSTVNQWKHIVEGKEKIVDGIDCIMTDEGNGKYVKVVSWEAAKYGIHKHREI